MTDEQINIEIAQHLGWRAIAFNEGIGVIGIPPARNECDPVHLKSVMWTADLNEMHEAESTLPYNMHGPEFTELLLKIVSRDHDPACVFSRGSFAHVHANARQRAEAFLRVLKKWEDK